jgi:hypothetical protein
MNRHNYGFRCSVVFDGSKYLVTRLRDVKNSFAFYQRDVGKNIKIKINPDRDDLFSYCRPSQHIYYLTLPLRLANFIKKNK